MRQETQYELLKKLENAERERRLADAHVLRRRLRHQLVQSAGAVCEGALDCTALPSVPCVGGRHRTCSAHAATCVACAQNPGSTAAEETTGDRHIGKRRSDRVSMALPIQIVGTDLSGQDFVQIGVTKQLSRYGGSMVLDAALGPEQIVTLRLVRSGAEAPIKIVGQVGLQAEGHVYGFTFEGERDKPFWGIHFPPLDQDGYFIAKALLECAACNRREIKPLNEVEIEVFEANDCLRWHCPDCRETTTWRQATLEKKASPQGATTFATGQAEQAVPPSPQTRTWPEVELRASRRVRVSLKGCVLLATEEEVVSVLDMSRGGIRFRCQKRYGIDQWVQVAAPYTVGGANIFRPARIVWRQECGATAFDYGLKFMKN